MPLSSSAAADLKHPWRSDGENVDSASESFVQREIFGNGEDFSQELPSALEVQSPVASVKPILEAQRSTLKSWKIVDEEDMSLTTVMAEQDLVDFLD
jgi:hypothetical protein